MKKSSLLSAIAVFAFLAALGGLGVGVSSASSDEAISSLRSQLDEKYPNLEAIRAQFGSGYYGEDATWSETQEPSMHDDTIMLTTTWMMHPAIEIAATEVGDNFFLVLVRVEEAGVLDFLGIDKGSSKEDVIRAFGEPDSSDDASLHYEDVSGYTNVRFELDDNDNVWRMRYAVYLD